MSSIPYPHRVEVWRTPRGATLASPTLDGWDNPQDGTPSLVETMPCWLQDFNPRERAEVAAFAEDGDVKSLHKLFCEPRTFESTDYLLTVQGGGLRGGVRLRVLHPTNPDGGLDHLEVMVLEVNRGAE